METKPLNQTTARAEAIRRWGVRGKVRTDRYRKPRKSDGAKHKMVGVHGYYDWDIFTVLGSGWTWEEAFEKAEKRIAQLRAEGRTF